MKKIYLFATLLFSSNLLFAQNLSATDIGFIPGDNYTLYLSDYINPGSAGTGVTWNFSTMTNNSQIEIATSAHSGAPFSSANFKFTQSSGSVHYYNVSSSDMEIVGLESAGSVFDYSDPLISMKFPVTSSYNYTDAFAASYTSSGIPVNRTGTAQSQYSGMGTLITPAGTFTNVVRIKNTQTIKDSSSGGSANVSIVSYSWYKAGAHHEIANVSDFTFSNTTSQSAYYTSVPIGLGLEENELISLLVFPNPATNSIHINSDEVISKVEVYQLSGELAMEHAANDTALEIDLTALNTGMYLVKVYGKNDAVSVKRITKN